jgi:Rieske Fe-S protein
MEPTAEPSPPLADARPVRRTFFQWVTAGLGAIATMLLGIPFVGYLLTTRKEPVIWVPLGKVADFPAGETRMVTFDNPIRQPWDGMVAHTGVYVRYEGKDGVQDKFLVLAVNCAHLGCPVSWFPQSGLFMCPCHGGVYYANGDRASGPPPRGLFPYTWRVRDGKLEVQAPHYPTLHDQLTTAACGKRSAGHA